jgi:glycosyltransferase involved in cell wall biosynthesis
LGWITNIQFFLQSIDVLVLSSPIKSEGLPWTVLESMAVGTPVVTTNSGGVIDAVKNGETGVVVFEQDETLLAKGVIKLLKDRGFSLRLAQNGRQVVETHFNFQREAQEFYELYMGLQNK